MTKKVHLYMAIAVDETGTVLLPFPHVLVKTEQTPTAYEVFILSLLSIKVLYFLDAIPDNIPQCHQKIKTRKGSWILNITIEQSHVDSSQFKG